ncbi:MAG: methyltransferase domain-containing protein [Nitrospirales bacterium]
MYLLKKLRERIPPEHWKRLRRLSRPAMDFWENLRERIPPERRKKLSQRLRRLSRPAWLGTLRRTRPLSSHFGLDRGTPVDRYYIEQFLEEHQQDIHGYVLEVKDSRYIDRYGTAVARREILDIDPANPRASIIADLSAADSIPSNTFDCFILTQTLMYIYDVHSAVSHAHRILRPGGVLLVTVPVVSRYCTPKADYWRFTLPGCSALFGEVFGQNHIIVRSYGNVLAAIAFLTGMAYEELSNRELDVKDDYIPLIITVRAVKNKGDE